MQLVVKLDFEIIYEKQLECIEANISFNKQANKKYCRLDSNKS